MKLTVYIPCYNAEKSVGDTLRSLLDQSRQPDEILVIDDGSTDKTVEIVSKYPVRLLRHDRNRGLAAARNTAFINASYELVGAVDADVYPSRDWLEQLLLHFDESHVAGTGGRLIENFRQTPPDAWRSIQLCQDLGEQRIIIEGTSHKCIGGFGTIFRKSAVQEIGGYNERYRTNYEDVDLCKRLVRAGHKLIFEPKAVAYHLRRDTVGSVIRTAWQWDFYLHYLKGGYNNIWLKILFNFRFARVLVWNHIRSGHFSLLPIDLRLAFQHSVMDLRYYFSPARLSHVDPSSSKSTIYIPWPFRNYLKDRSEYVVQD
jgi:glycosyltransferase involved in cell wall biosynthesis